MTTPALQMSYLAAAAAAPGVAPTHARPKTTSGGAYASVCCPGEGP
eukprot:CAMPEP_0182873920 /NCGR_PEP_ID=MMETSP0034_2-20130328/12619_1 /TAXON_ID=156128 /ORGANISM="Nephroselmis pyriformis, Strain CCMP717" /LENGTH=45 /DNA_ID= /DNA_START= /DNA_END= /DNA_ORIENTATION=